MGLDELHSWVLRELANEVAKPLSITFENSWQSGEVPTKWKRRNIMPISKREKRKTWGSTGSRSHLCARQNHGADPPGNYAKAHGK